MKFKLNLTRFLCYALLSVTFTSLALTRDGYSQTFKRNLADYKFGGSFNLREILFPAKNQEKVLQDISEKAILISADFSSNRMPKENGK